MTFPRLEFWTLFFPDGLLTSWNGLAEVLLEPLDEPADGVELLLAVADAVGRDGGELVPARLARHVRQQELARELTHDREVVRDPATQPQIYTVRK